MSENRREVATRQVAAFQSLAKLLVRWGLTPNQVSVMSSVFALLGGASIASSAHVNGGLAVLLLVGGIVGIQLRLICNLIDGLMAVEGGLKTAAGELFNDVPDRISDVFIILGGGWVAQLHFSWMMQLGWLAALLAVLTAYVRALGASMTGRHDFAGPMAKQHRMFLMTLGCLGTLFEVYGIWAPGWSFSLVVILIAAGSLATCVNRLRRTYNRLARS